MTENELNLSPPRLSDLRNAQKGEILAPQKNIH